MQTARRNWKPILAGLAAIVFAVSLAFTSSTEQQMLLAAAAKEGQQTTTCGVAEAVAVTAAVPAEYVELIQRASTSVAGALPAPLFAAQIWAESKFNPNAKSPVGAAGLIQFMPGTWAAHGIDGDGDGRADILNPVDNAMSSAAYTAYLGGLIDKDSSLTGDPVDLRLAAYNAGLGNVKKYGGVPPFKETRDYVAKIRAKAREYGGEGALAIEASNACEAVQDVVASGGFAAPIKAGAYRLSSGFGPRKSPGGVGSTNHAGTDLAAPIGTPIYAVQSGKVLKAGAASGYGQAVYIDSGGIIYRYGHVSAFHTTTGATVQAGQLIADVGNEGRSTGPHLHLECRPNDVPTNCVPYLAQRGVTL